MAYCVKCGTQVDDTVKFCPQCGEEIPHVQGNADTAQSYTSSRSARSEGACNTGCSNEYTYYQGNDSSQQTYSSQPDREYSGAGSQSDYFDSAEVAKNKAMGVLSYIGILVLIPLLAGDRKSEYVKFHSNQGLVLFIVSSVIDLLEGDWIWGFHSWINFGGSALSWILDIADFACLILMVVGIVAACRGERKELPLLGRIKIIK